MSKSFTTAEVAKHKTDKDGMYIIVDNGVYDITGVLLSAGHWLFLFLVSLLPPTNLTLPGFIDEHPGGAKILKRMAGRDASKPFWKYHSAKVLDKYTERLKVGTVAEAPKL